MDKEPYCNLKNNRFKSDNQVSYREYLEDNTSEVLEVSNDPNCCWIEEREDDKCNVRKRWSYGSDTSVEGIENGQNRLCCSPVDEFESLGDNEIDIIIVNNTDESQESYEDYLQTSPIPSPTEENVICNSEGKRSKTHDVDTADDELIDYSKRYTTESSMLTVDNKQGISSNVSQNRRNIISNTIARNVPVKKTISNSNRSKVDLFGDYAETDLDQPTNYSLLYVEEDTDEEEEREENSKFYCNGRQEDTVKTYYTEGTPYETPNFSNSTSMSDLLSLEDSQEREETSYKKQYSNEQKRDMNNKSDKPVKDLRNDIKRKNNLQEPKHPALAKIVESENPERCENKINKLLTPLQSSAEQCDKVKESKTVTFSSEDNFAQETPLMYSRSSSLDSLDEFDQHFIHDDGSSVISDFSYRTSTVVSPSELPDSPTQTVPPSPRKLKQQNFYNQHYPPKLVIPTARLSTTQNHPENSKELSNQNFINSKPKMIIEQVSIFEDGLVSFKEESISGSKPNSTTESLLSALTIDDKDDNNLSNNQEIINRIAAIKVRSSAAGMHQAPMQKQYYNNTFNQIDKFSCQPQFNKIPNRHLAGNKYSRNNCLLDSFPREEIHYTGIEDSNEHLTYSDRDSKNNRHQDPYYENCLRNNNQNYSNRPLSLSSATKCGFAFPQKADLDEIITIDTLTTYCTENTPIYTSPYGSQSNLSALSALSISDENLGFYEKELRSARSYNEEVRVYESDASSSLSEDDITGCDDRRIDVSPFDSQLNLDSFALLSIEEEDEEVENEDGNKSQEAGEEINNETDNPAKDDSCTENVNAFKTLSLKEFDYSEEGRKVFKDSIKSRMLKISKSMNDFITDGQ